MNITDILFIIILIPSVILHEVSHGYIALKMGDHTAKYSGRLTLNPIPHIDPIGSILVPLILIIMPTPYVFGWAKPVPINPYNFRNPRKDMMWVGLSGPATNLTLALGFSLLKTLMPANYIGSVLNYAAFINIILAVLNLIPIPPLDGSRVLTGLLPRKAAYNYMKLEPYGIILVLLFITTIGTYIIGPIIYIITHLFGVNVPMFLINS